MTEKKQYVRPPKPVKIKPTVSRKKLSHKLDAYNYLHPDYWKRKLAHLLLVIPVVWYRESLIGRILNGMWYFGGFWAVIGKIIVTLIGGILIAGLLAPIAGPITLRRCRRKNIIIGDAKDFE